jgi:hypothetical protein
MEREKRKGEMRESARLSSNLQSSFQVDVAIAAARNASPALEAASTMSYADCKIALDLLGTQN